MYDSANVTLLNSVFTENQATSPGSDLATPGVNAGVTLNVTGCSFVGSSGVALRLRVSHGSVHIAGCVFEQTPTGCSSALKWMGQSSVLSMDECVFRE